MALVSMITVCKCSCLTLLATESDCVLLSQSVTRLYQKHLVIHPVFRQSVQLCELTTAKNELEHAKDDLQLEMESQLKREAESLLFTERITMKNSQLQSENLHLMTEVTEFRMLPKLCF